MALIRTSPMVSGISGTIGGTNFLISGQRAIARQAQRKSAGTGLPQASATGGNFISATNSQADMKIVAAAWRALTSAQQLVWNTIAASERWPDRLGQARAPSGREAFFYQSLFWQRSSAFALASDAPTLGIAPPPYSLSLITTGGTVVKIRYSKLATTGSNTHVYFYAKPWYQATTPSRSRKLTFVSESATSSAAGTEDIDITDAYEAIWPFPTTNQRISFIVRLVTDNHWTSAPARLEATYS